MKKERPLSPKDSQKIINELNSLDLAIADYSYVKDLVLKLKVEIKFKGGITNPRHRFYRGIIYYEKPMLTKLLSYPPSNLVTNFQRANPPGCPMFYCSTNPGIPFAELEPSLGDKLYLSKWSVYHPFGAVMVDFCEDDSYLARFIKSFYQKKLSQKVHGAVSTDYKISCAIAESISFGSISDNFGRKMSEMGAIIYPSVKMKSHQENVAIRPEIVDSCLKLDYVEEYIIKSIEDDTIYADKLDFANEFPDRNINWKGRPSHLAVTKKTGDLRKLKRENFGWVIRDKDGNILDPV